MAFPPNRVASRHLISRVWTDPGALWTAYSKALTELDRSITQEKAQPRPNQYILKHYFVPVVNSGRVMAEWAIQTRTIPSGMAKSLELAARLMGLSRVPSNIIQWYDTNRPKLNFLLETMAWGEKSAGPSGGLELATVGPFKVHNTIGAKEEKFKELQGLVNTAVKAISPVRDFKRVLYGDVFVVGQLRQAQSLAWYSVKEDEVYLRNLAKKGFDDLQNFIHELGHRYWFKFATANQRRNISLLYSKLGWDARRVSVPDLKVGDVLPVKVVGLEPPVVITEVTPTNYVLRPKKLPLGTLPGSSPSVKITAIRDVLKRREVAGKLFPTVYSMKNNEEFFAECFAFYILGKLPKVLVPQFEEALK